MLDRLRTFITWPIAAVLIAGGLIFGAITIWGPPEAREWLFGANGLLWTLIAYVLRSPAQRAPSSSGGATPAPSGAVLLAFALLAPSLTACAGPVRATRDVLAVTSRAVVETDHVVAVEYTAAADRALADAADLAAYHASMQRWDRVEVALRTARASLLACESAVDAWEAGTRDGIGAALPGLAGALVEVLAALTEAGIDPPSTLTRAVSMLHTAIGGAS